MGIVKPPFWRQLGKGHCLVRDKSLNGLWLMNEGMGTTVIDATGDLGDGTFSGTPTWKAGRTGWAIDCGDADTIASISHRDLPTNFSILITFKTSVDYTANQHLFYIHNQCQLRFQSDDHIDMYCFDGGWQTVTSNATLNDGAWHQAVVVGKQGSSCELFVDGISQGTDTLGTITDASTPFYIGNDYNGTAGAMADIDLCMRFDSALSSSEVARLYANPYWAIGMDTTELWTGYVAAAAPGVKPWWYYQRAARRRAC